MNAFAILILCTAFAGAALADVPQGRITVDFDLSDGRTETVTLTRISEQVTIMDPVTPKSLCTPPLIRRFNARQYFGTPSVGILEVTLAFDENGIGWPAVRINGSTASSLSTVDYDADGVVEVQPDWSPSGRLERVGAEWGLDMVWDFQPAPQMQAVSVGSTAGPVIRAPRWIDTVTGGAAPETIERLRVASTIRFRATYPDPDTMTLQPCD